MAELSNTRALQCTAALMTKATELGACLVGICSVDELKSSPSFALAPKLLRAEAGRRQSDLGLGPGEVYWPADAKSAVVIAYAHPAAEPELDWWHGRSDPPGNRVLADIIRDLSLWAKSEYAMKSYPLPYHVERGGIFLKDAAVQAGLGCIGQNNLLITPEYGPRVRLRAMLLTERLAATGPRHFDPCSHCDGPCLTVCPQGAFSAAGRSADTMGQPAPPGNYDRHKCNVQMGEDVSRAKEEDVPEVSDKPVRIVKYCRHCELSCPVGR